MRDVGPRAQSFDAVVIGAGAAGMMCAATAGQRGPRVLLIDHYPKVGEKIRISGGGRCNFTNLHATPADFLSTDPDFCRPALERHTPRDFIALVESHGIAWHEKTLGQLFCDRSSLQIIEMLRSECAKGRVEWWQPCDVRSVRHDGGKFHVEPSRSPVEAVSVVIATVLSQFAELAGVSMDVQVQCAGGRFRESLLFTHRGLSGPAILQISSYWQHARAAEPIRLDILPGLDTRKWLVHKRRSSALLSTLLAERVPKRFAQRWCAVQELDLPVAQMSDSAFDRAARDLAEWKVQPSGTLGYNKAEVTLGGVGTSGLSRETMEATTVKGLYFIGEAVDVTGHLGGFNFQWAWSSGRAAGQALGAL